MRPAPKLSGTSINSFTWNCNNTTGVQSGTICSGSGLPACVTCRYTTVGTKTATLTVQDANGCIDDATVFVTVDP